jgi:hypothetical protein
MASLKAEATACGLDTILDAQGELMQQAQHATVLLAGVAGN